jgi:polyhydroxybutyrate depolymerase
LRVKVAAAFFLIFLILLTACQQRNSAPSTMPEDGSSQTTALQEVTSPNAVYNTGDYQFEMNVDGRTRTYVVYIPEGYNADEPSPVIIAIHGGGGTGRGTMEMTQIPAKADVEGFIAIFPNGTAPFPSKPARFASNPQTWNDGSGRGFSGKNDVNDVSFISTMIDDIAAKFTIDHQRIYATGLSNGASMSFRLGVDLSQRIAAIAPVAGHFWMENPQISRPVPMLYITGTADPLNPIEGGPINIPFWQYSDVKPPVQDAIMKWVELIGCPSKSVTIRNKNGVKAIAYSPCQGNAEVVYYTVEGLGHHWPGGNNKLYLPEEIVGKTSNKLIANDVIWDFFKKHPKN